MEFIVGLYEINSELRKQHLEEYEKLPWKDIVKKRGASFESIRNVFLHILDAYRYWFEYIVQGKPGKFRPVDPKKYRNVEDMRKYEKKVDSLVMSIVRNLKDKDLSRVYTVYWGKVGRKIDMKTILMHMAEEELLHLGEINCMFWQQDLNAPAVRHK